MFGGNNGQKNNKSLEELLKKYITINEGKWEENEKRWEENEKRWDQNEKRWDQNEKRMGQVLEILRHNNLSIKILIDKTSQIFTRLDRIEKILLIQSNGKKSG